MNLNTILMNGHGIYVWSSFILTFVICLFLFLKTRNTLKKLEKEFVRETQSFSTTQVNDLKKQKIAKEILVSHSRI